jgi:hypothetical protein
MTIAEQSWSSPILHALWHEMTAARRALEDEVGGLSDAQLGFQPGGGWSIGEILDHLCLSEQSITRAVSRLLQQAAGLGQIAEPGHWDPPTSEIDRALYDRPASAPESVRPSPDRALEPLLADLAESRQRFQDVTRRADGRAVGPVTLAHFQLGQLNFYQWLAVEGAHEAKHLAAIRRIKTDPRFPRA